MNEYNFAFSYSTSYNNCERLLFEQGIQIRIAQYVLRSMEM